MFEAFNDDLTRSVAHAVVASPETIDDACAFAWAQFLHHQPDRDRNWQGWLFRVAQREAWRLDGAAKQTVPYQAQDEPEPGVLTVHQVASPGDPQWERLELNAVTEILAALPPRVRQVAMLRATGNGYKEIAELTGDTERTVHRLVRRVNESIGEAVREATRHDKPNAPRAQRLESLERKPPRWLVTAIGRPPGWASSTSGLLAWRRAALIIDDYRRVAGFVDERQPVGSAPTERHRQRVRMRQRPAPSAGFGKPASTGAHSTRHGEGSQSRSLRPCYIMLTMALDPVVYRGELVALAGDERFHIAPRLQDVPAGDPELRFITYMCLCKAEVVAGRISGPYTSELAQTWARAA